MSIDGTYKITVDTPIGKQENTLMLKAEGDSLSGTAKSMLGTENFSGGKVDGNKFEFGLEVNSPMGKMKLDFQGTVDGDKISGSVKTPFGDSPFSGERE